MARGDGIYVAIRNWGEFQHYKDERPVHWIKLYVRLLDDYDFLRLEDAARWHLVGLWLVATKVKNRIPLDPAHLERALHATGPVDLDKLLEVGWLVPLDVSVESARKHLSDLNVRNRTKPYETVPRVYKEERELDTSATHSGDARVENLTGTAYCAARYLPVMREVGFRPSLSPDATPAEKKKRHSVEGQDVGICVQMLAKGADPDETEDAILGLAWLRDHGAITWLPKGEPTSMRALYNTKSGVTTVWSQAVHAAHKHIHEKKPTKKSGPQPFTVNIGDAA